MLHRQWGMGILGGLALGLVMAAPAGAAAPSNATTAARSAVAAVSGDSTRIAVEEAQYRYHHRGPRYHRRHHRRYHHRPRVHRGWGAAHVRWCYSRYRSYREWDNTYQPYGGPRRQCISPY